jgi:hypothetical protein
VGHTCLGTYRANQTGPGLFSFDLNGNFRWDSGTDSVANFGPGNDLPFTGRWTLGGNTRIGIFHPPTQQWNLDWNGDNVFDPSVDKSFTAGTSADVPVTGDWNGDGTAKLGIYRNGQWILDLNGDGKFVATFNFGGPGDKPVVFWR